MMALNSTMPAAFNFVMFVPGFLICRVKKGRPEPPQNITAANLFKDNHFAFALVRVSVFLAHQNRDGAAQGRVHGMVNDRDTGHFLVFRRHEVDGYSFSRGHGVCLNSDQLLSLIHISEPTRLGMISYAVF